MRRGVFGSSSNAARRREMCTSIDRSNSSSSPPFVRRSAAGAASDVLRLSTPPRGDMWGIESASELARLLLPPDNKPERDERVLNTLSQQFDSDVTLFDSEG